MYLTIPATAVWAIIVLVLCALTCVGVLLRKAKRTALALEKEKRELEVVSKDLNQREKELLSARRDLDIKDKNTDDLQERIKGLEDSLAACNAECSRLQRLVEKSEKDKKDANEERDTQTARANAENVSRLNTENVSRLNTETQLFAARHGEDPETESFYRDHLDLLTAAPAEPAADAAAEPATEEVAPAEAEKKPKANKKRSTKG